MVFGWERRFSARIEGGMRRRSRRGPNTSESTGKIGQELPSNQPAPLVPLYPDDVPAAPATQPGTQRTHEARHGAQARQPGPQHGQHHVTLGCLSCGVWLGRSNCRHLRLGFHLQTARSGRLIPLGPGLLRLRAVLAMLRTGVPVLCAVPGFMGPLRAGLSGPSSRHIVRIQRHQRSLLIRWEFLTDLACGFRCIRAASRASSHGAFNPCRNPCHQPEYHTRQGRCKLCVHRHIQFHRGSFILMVGDRVRGPVAHFISHDRPG